MKNKKIFLLWFLCGFFLMSGLFFWLITWYVPRLNAEGWLRGVLLCKLDIAARTPSPKIILLSGSNTLFGMDSETLEKRCGFPVVNLAFHAAFPINYYEHLLKDVLKEGDMVILPLELEHYTRDSDKNEITLLTGLSWGKEFFPSSRKVFLENIFFYTFPYVRKVSFVKDIPRNVLRFRKFHLADKHEILETFHQIEKQPPDESSLRPEEFYSYKNMNRYGDIVFTKPVTIDFLPKLTSTTEPSAFFLHSIQDLARFVQARDAGFALVWPVLYSGDDHDKILQLKQNCQDKNITIHGDPAKFVFPEEDFSDARYHLRSSAAKKRAEILADCLRENNLLPSGRPLQKKP